MTAQRIEAAKPTKPKGLAEGESLFGKADAPNPLYQEGYSMTDNTDRLASVSSASAEPGTLDWRLIAKAAGEHGVRYRTNTAMAKFLAAVTSPEPVPATNQAGEVERLRAELQPLIEAATGPNGWDWMFPLRVKPVDGKPTIVSHKGGNLFRGYIGTWTEADLLVALANAAPRILAALATQPATSQEGEDEDRLTGEGAWDILVNVDDRTSPEEYPDMCLITRDELIEFMSRAAPLSRAPSTDLRKLGQAIGAEIDRQCSIGAGTCGTADDGSGLFEVNASLDLNGFAHAMSRAARAQVKA